MKRTTTQWEDAFRLWAGGPGDTELQKCENAERMIRKAISASSDLNKLDIEVFSQGSFRNTTNIPQESDVDVSVCLHDWFYYDLPSGAIKDQYGFASSGLTYQYGDYKRQVVDAISRYFDASRITVGNKAIRIHSNTYRVDADVVPNFEYRSYSAPQQYRAGVRFYADDGSKITNWPKQHIDKGIDKNVNTSKRFKRIARVLKSLQVEMLAKQKISNRQPSFFLESLVYNVPDEHFGHDLYRDDVRAVLAYIFNNTRTNDDPNEWTEVNDIKYLFRSTQPWKKADAFAFVSAAWNHIGFDN